METTTTASRPKLSRRVWLAVILLGFSGQLAWGVENQYFNTFMYDKITPDPRPISWMVAASAIAATLTSLLMGTLSDRTRTRWGKRKPFILFGYLAWGVATAAFPSAAFLRPVGLAVGIAILFDSIMTFFGSTANDAALNAYVADVTSTENRGRVVGVMEILTWVAMLIVYGASGLIIEAWGYFAFFYLIGGMVFVLGLIGGLLVHEQPDPTPPSRSYWGQIGDTFKSANLRANRDLFLLLFALTLYGIAEQIFFPYLIIYLNHYLELPTLQASLLIFVAILVGGIALAYPFGVLADRIGRKWLAFGAIALKLIGLDPLLVDEDRRAAGADGHRLAGRHVGLDDQHRGLDQGPLSRRQARPVRRIFHPVHGGAGDGARSADRGLAGNAFRHPGGDQRAGGIHPHPAHLPGGWGGDPGGDHPAVLCERTEILIPKEKATLRPWKEQT